MVSSGELKQQAKDSLKGRWGQAILLNLIPTLITIAIILILALPTALLIATMQDSSAMQEMVSGSSSSSSGGGIVSTIISALFMSGISWTYLDIIRGKRTTIEPFKDAFRGFSGVFFGGVLLLALVTTIFTTLWALLLVIPGIIKGYAYSQSYFIYYDVVTETGEKPKILDTITATKAAFYEQLPKQV